MDHYCFVPVKNPFLGISCGAVQVRKRNLRVNRRLADLCCDCNREIVLSVRFLEE